MSSNIKIPKARQLPSGSWRCEVYINNQRYSFVEADEDEAVRKAMLCKLSNSADPEIRKKSLDHITFTEAIDRYLADRDSILSPSTIKSYKSYQKYRIQSVMDLPLSANINWQKVINDEAKEVSPKTVKNIWGMVTAVLNDNKIQYEDIALPALIKNDPVFLEPEEIKTLVKAIEGHRFEMMYLLCLHGLRRSEACAMKPANIKDGYIHVRGAKVYDSDGNLVLRKENKTYESNRDLPVMIERLNVLASQCDTEFLCMNKPSSAVHPLKTICRQNNLPEVTLHQLRHSFASLCYHLGISEMQCMEFGGWSDIHVMRKIYTHLAKEDRKNAEEKLKVFFK